MDHLQKIWTIDGWLSDSNHDGVPDGLKTRFILGRNNSALLKRGWIELAGRIGLESTAVSFPLMQWDDAVEDLPEFPVLIGIEHRAFCEDVIADWNRYERKRNGLQKGQGYIAIVQLQRGGTATIVTGRDSAGVYSACLFLATMLEDTWQQLGMQCGTEWIVPPENTRTDVLNSGRGRQETRAGINGFGLESFFTDSGLFRREDHSLQKRVRVRMQSENWRDEEIEAAGNLAARIGLEATDLEFPIAAEAVSSAATEQATIVFQGTGEKRSIQLSEENGRMRLRIEGAEIVRTVRWVMDHLFGTNDQFLRRSWRQAAAILNFPAHPMRRRLLHEFSLERVLRMKTERQAHVALPENLVQPIGLWQDVAKRAGVSAQFQIQQNEPVLTLKWEESGEFDRILKRAAEAISDISNLQDIRVEAGVNLSPASRERLAAEMQTLIEKTGGQGHVRIQSAWKQGYWWIEQEVLPELRQLGRLDSVEIRFRPFLPPSGRKALELPIRWLQELYPIDEVIGRHLDIDPDHITFVMDESLASTYLLTARDAQGNVIQQFQFAARTGEMFFLAGFPEEGYVYPPTGWLRIFVNDSLQFDQAFETDLERFWNWYQGSFLEKMMEWINREGKQTTPLFNRIDCHVRMDAEERLLGIQEETYSPMEALHEDIYFQTLDYFSAAGKAKGLDWEAPGQILPWIEAVPGVSPHAWIQVYDLARESSGILVDGQRISSADIPVSKVVAISWVNEDIQFSLDCKGPLKEEVEDWLSGLHRFQTSRQAKKAVVSSGIPMCEVIDDNRIEELYETLATLPGVQVVPLEISYQGRPISIAEVTLPSLSETVSRSKLALWKPTVFINARHHANEVSSTNAVLKLVETVSTKQPSLLKTCNLVVSPLANPDGVALHYAMFAANPRWKHHAARYNAAGFEYARHRFKQDTPYGESRVYEKIWRRWAPDIVVDDHGVPSHEWIQPFSGYNSPPRFPVSYWLPNALIYTITRSLDNLHYSQQSVVRESVLQTLSARISGNRDMHCANEYWRKRYEKWGHQWLPEIFPLQTVNGLISYQWKANVSADSTNLGERFPDLVSLDLITEVADETADGDYLSRCVQAHYELDLGIVEWVSSHSQPILRSREETAFGYSIRLDRPRPLQI